MGFFRTLLIFFIFYCVFKFVLRPFLEAAQKKPAEKPNDQIPSLTDKIVPCPTCGTYNPTKQALFADGNYYCNLACVAGKKQETN
ncbi:MAG: hypothetical protein ACD_73C00480G0003 [uncultured bacterium]|nr:MAG: hypothetical protein ACD_73C00480G0003 [uncultured bacterium]